ncbi:hypothetical protein EZV62_027097 [Acer yangbiense]|uniref:Uncharacterized protein n=1 Tax=Acer yangbiense TaxID=1000413 RepID=A0A5C7GT56_9ROSI|nr:hypothetical protein EZV62_027097 [Acer yangbiense]
MFLISVTTADFCRLSLPKKFRSSLEFHEVEKPVAINKFIYLLQMADTELKNNKNLEGWSMDGSDHGLPDSKVLKDQAWSTLKPGLKQYEEDVDAVEMKRRSRPCSQWHPQQLSSLARLDIFVCLRSEQQLILIFYSVYVFC